MIKHRVLVAGLVAALLPVAGSVSHAAGAARRGGKITIGRATINPTRVSGGSSVNIRVKVTGKGVTITSVQAYASVPGTRQNGQATTLQSTGSNTYSGTVIIPANGRGRRQTSKIWVKATSTNGSAKKQVGTVRVSPVQDDPNTPPPPPNI
jgi:hypothetical protein